jgi:hypothetical protein
MCRALSSFFFSKTRGLPNSINRGLPSFSNALTPTPYARHLMFSGEQLKHPYLFCLRNQDSPQTHILLVFGFRTHQAQYFMTRSFLTFGDPSTSRRPRSIFGQISVVMRDEESGGRNSDFMFVSRLRVDTCMACSNVVQPIVVT